MTTHNQPFQHWIATTDNRRAALLSCRGTPGGELALDRVRSLENSHEGEHSRGRPSMIGGSERAGSARASSGSAAPHFTSRGHEEEEEHRRFAREVAAWLDRSGAELKCERITVFAPARLLGMLRDLMGHHPSLRAKADLVEGELAQLQPTELAAHPAVRAAAGGSDRRR